MGSCSEILNTRRNLQSITWERIEPVTRDRHFGWIAGLKTIEQGKHLGKHLGKQLSKHLVKHFKAPSRRFGRLFLSDRIPSGCLAVYVGGERRRFIIRTKYLSHQLFKELLKRSEEEFGFQYKGGLNVACEPRLFEVLLWMIANNKDHAHRDSKQAGQLSSFVDLPR